MPGQVPKNGSGHVPGPDTRIVELRVHGILGTTGSALTDSVASVDVAGDGVGRIVRPADRLRRPVPGPALVTGERTVPRIVEGYVWSRMTSGGLAKATWALLFPFALANVADWMLPPAPQESRLGKIVGLVLRGLLRLAAVLLTMLLAAQLTVVSLDVVAAQCLRPGSGCMAYIPESLRDITVLRAITALVPLGLVVLSLYRLSTVSWNIDGDRTQSAEHTTRAPVLPGANVVADPDTPALRALHACAALSTVALLALGGPFAPSADLRWLLAAALAVLTIVATAIMDDPTGQDRARTGLRLTLQRRTRRVLMSLSALPLVGVAVVPPRLDGTLPGSDSTIGALTFLLLVTCVLVGILLLTAALLAKPVWARLSAPLRPWAGGWMAAPILMIACLLGTGFGAGLAECVRQLLGADGLVLPRAYDDVALVWGAAAVLLLLSALVIVPVVLIDRWRVARAQHGVPAEVALLHAGRKQDQRSAANAWRSADLQRRYSHQVLLLIAAVLALSVVLSEAARSASLEDADWLRWLGGVGVAMLIAVAGGLARMVYLAATRRETARHLGVLCDLTLFWPREAHPFVPPCYALKVVPELVARAREHLTDPDTRVVLVGHSQGSLLAAVATARLLSSLEEADRDRVGLVTAGSQLQWAYPRAFPGVVPHDSLRDLAASLGGRWRSLCRGTDPLGGAVGTWNRQVYDGMLIGVGFRTDGTEGPLPPATRGPTGALVLGSDHWLPDPQRGPFAARRWVPGVRAHSDYSGDPEWDRAVVMAAGLDAPVRGSTLPLRTPAMATPASKPAGGDGQVLPVPGEDAKLVDEQPQRPTQPQVSDLPEIIDPRGRVAPWERVLTVRSS